MANFGTRLEEFRVFKRFKTQEEFAQTFGMSQKNIASWIAGSTPNATNIKKIVTAHPELNEDWLLFGRGDMIKPPKEKKPVDDRYIESLEREVSSLRENNEMLKELLSFYKKASPAKGN